ncbi:MAG: hypothetical protein IKU40_05540 [Clostridia bacterium]|nr:hypothetical protein [Clostridia bacterium]
MLSKIGAHIMIHSWAALHGATAFLLAQTPEGDTVLLTAETITFIVSLAKACGADLSTTQATAVGAQAVASVTGLSIAEAARHYAKYIPVAGNVFNAATSIAITEAIGFSVYNELRKKEAA